METTIVYWAYMGTKEKKMETKTIRGYCFFFGGGSGASGGGYRSPVFIFRYTSSSRRDTVWAPPI